MNTHRTESFRRLGIVALVLLVTLCSWYSPITDRAESSVYAGLQRSLLSFASARALNGAISAVQGTEVSVQPLGVGMTLSVGEVLDPVNDLVESFSSVMLMSSVAFGIEKLLLALGSGPLISALVTALALAWVLRFVHDAAPPLLTRLLLAAVFLRFVMPVTLIGSDYVFQHSLRETYEEGAATLDSTTAQVRAFDAEVRGQAEDPGQATSQSDETQSRAPTEPASTTPAGGDGAAGHSQGFLAWAESLWRPGGEGIPAKDPQADPGGSGSAAPSAAARIPGQGATSQAPDHGARPEADAEGTGSTIGTWTRQTIAAGQSGIQHLKDAAASVFAGLETDFRRQYDALAAAADRAAQRMINLIVVFLMQTIVVPLILLWGLYRLLPGLPIRPIWSR